MPDRSDKETLTAAARGDETAFASLYDRYHQRIRLVAWRVTHRADWLDDLLNEAWCRAFNQRTSFDPDRDFVVWLIGIVRNVYREFCREGKLSIAGRDELEQVGEVESEEVSPARLAQEAEILEELNHCVGQLSDTDGQIVRLRCFENQPLRVVAQQVNIPEATLRTRIPEVFERLRRCLAKKNIDVSDIFSAQGGGDSQ
ncbi:MAG TPA: RNA polymerase sigma factor [Phycisphaerae bacterium]|nr:RNA polymerase sigma factor [Phycisphaerae bacterium]HRW54013.1 RNA polymerase sigma factor [Phycisphaerae bacterium]